MIYYHGNRTYVGENIATANPKIKEKKLDLQRLAKSLYTSWLNSPPHYKNLINPNYTKMGLGYWKSKNGKIYAAQVFSSNEITLPKEFRNSDLSWGVRPSEFTCKDDKQQYESMYFANGTYVEGSSIYLYFHDLEFFEKVINSANDGLAVDIILREQLPCDKENQFHISAVYDGEMQRPIYKNDIYRHNISNNPKKIRFKIGEVPPYLQNRQWEANIIIINDNVLCEYSVPAEAPSDIFPLLPVSPYFELTSTDSLDSLNIFVPQIFHLKDSIHIELMYNRSDKMFFDGTEREYEKLVAFSHLIDEITVECNASVEGREWFNEQILKNREESVYSLFEKSEIDTSLIKILSKENWEMMNQQIVDHRLKKLKRKNNLQVKKYLKKNKSPFLDSLLFEQRKTHIYANVDTVIEIKNFHDLEIAQYYDSSYSLNDLPWNELLKDEYIIPEEPIYVYLIDSLRHNTELKTNLFGAASIGRTNEFMDSVLVTDFLKDVDEENSIQVFNYANFLTKYWYSNYSGFYETKGVAKSISPDVLKAMLSKIDTTVISPKDLTRLKVNNLLAGIHYFVAYNNWERQNKYFDIIAELVQSDNFTEQEAMELALFCNHFHKFDISVDILDKFHHKDLLSENGKFILAQTSTLIRGELDQAVYHGYMESAKKANHDRYCKWLDDSFQIQRDEYLKEDFCGECLVRRRW